MRVRPETSTYSNHNAIKIVVSVICCLLVAASLVLLFFRNYAIYSIVGDSMHPTLKNHQILLLEKTETISNGDVTVARKPEAWNSKGDEGGLLIKRVKATSGDLLTFSNKVLKVNDKVIYSIQDSEDCKTPPSNYSHRLSSDEVFVMGDNVLNSVDSRVALCLGKMNDVYIKKSDVVAVGNIKKTF